MERSEKIHVGDRAEKDLMKKMGRAEERRPRFEA